MSTTPACLTVVTLGVRMSRKSVSSMKRSVSTQDEVRGRRDRVLRGRRRGDPGAVGVGEAGGGCRRCIRAAPGSLSRDDAGLELRDAGGGRCCLRPGDRGWSEQLLKAPEKTFYGGYRGYFADPDGHVWEVVQAPGFAVLPTTGVCACLIDSFPAFHTITISRLTCGPRRAPSRHESHQPAPARSACRSARRTSARRSAASARRSSAASGRSRAATRPGAGRSRARWWPPPSSSIPSASRAGSTIPRSSIRDKREKLYAKICASAEVAVAFGRRRASTATTSCAPRCGRWRARWRRCRCGRELVFVDGRDRIDCGCDCEAVISRRCAGGLDRGGLDRRQGHARPADGAAGARHPGYGFERHMGYSVPEHFARAGPARAHDPSSPLVRAGAR